VSKDLTDIQDTQKTTENSKWGLFNLRKRMYNDQIRMRRLQGLLALGIALSATAVAAQTRNASVNYTFRETALKGYRMGDEFLLPLDAVADLGWSAGSASAGTKIYAENNTLQLPTRQVNGKQCIPLREAINQLGGISTWNPGGYDILQVSSPVFEINVKNGIVNIQSALAVKPTVSVMGSKKVIIDLEGAKFSRDTKIDSDGSTNVSQYGPNTVRIVLNLDFVPSLPKLQLPSASNLKINLNPEAIAPPKPEPPKDTTPPKQDPIPNPGPITELPLGLDWENQTSSSLSIKFEPGKWKGTATYRRPNSDVLEIVLSNLNCELPKNFKLHSSAVKEVSSSIVGTTTVLRLELKRAMGADIVASASGVVINLVRPNSTGGKLNGKVIVIDAGHGGSDNGSMAGGAREKDITLFLSRMVRDELKSEGATVIMTRDDDSFPSLESRPELANRNSADIFLSIHANEPGRRSNTTATGSIIFYHKGSSISKFLGECVQTELMKYNLLPSTGLRSDSTIYSSGFAVLRLSNMPGLLIETGFMTNPKDRQMIQSEQFGRALAKSIVSGLKTYYGQ
jgi:N-acetylmuramoyl-L-alanine amidase